MIDELKPYPEYKDSGVEWLGEVPAHWEVLPNRAVFTEVREREHPDEEMLSVTITRGVIRQRELLADSSKKDISNLDRSAYKLVRPGDLVYNKMRAWQGALGVSDHRGIVSPAYVIQRPKPCAAPRYLHFLLRIPAFAKEAERWSYGITSDMWSLRPEHFKLIYSCIPPLPEQTAIVRFLDYVDRRVRRVIRARQRLVKLLEEYKQALIHQAVTGRIDARTGGPYPEYKDSGVEWLGDVPSHWEVVQLARCIHHIDQGWSPVAAEGGVNEDQWVVLTLSAVRRGRFDPGAFKPIPVNASIPAGIEVCEGDLLITRSNTPDRVGDVCIVKGVRPRTILCDLIYRLRLRNQDLETGYLMRVLLSRVGRDQIERDARGSSGTMPKISQQRMRAWRIALPPLPEQTAIVRFLDEQTASLDRAAQAARREIDLLEELRTRLIADVVTGKLDVREVAARLPEEEDESELLDELEAGAGVGGGAGDLDETPVEAEA